MGDPRDFWTLNIDEPLARIKADGTLRYYQRDALGSVIALTDSTEAIKTQYVYDPFGSTTVIGEGSDNPFQYTGRENDGTGLIYYRARYYSPEMQRFISEDPIGIAGGINFFAYVGNNPINFSDPLGLTGQYLGPNNGWQNTETGAISKGYPESNEPANLDNLSTLTELLEAVLHGALAIVDILEGGLLTLTPLPQDSSAAENQGCKN